MFLCISIKNFCSRDEGNFYLVDGRGLNNLLKEACCIGLVKCFILIDNFGNSTIFQHFHIPSIALKGWNFPDNLNFKENNMTIKQQNNHGTIQKEYLSHNGIFHPIYLCHTLSPPLCYLLKITNYGMREKKTI